MEEDTGIYRGEVLVIMGALAEAVSNTRRIIELLEGEDGEEEEVSPDG